MHMICSPHVADGMMLGCFYNEFENHYGVLVHQTEVAIMLITCTEEVLSLNLE
jgi:hypothetical protein